MFIDVGGNHYLIVLEVFFCELLTKFMGRLTIDLLR